MDRGSAERLLETLGCMRIRVIGHEITATCPFMENHYRGDRRPSFSAKLDEGRSPFFCHGCHEKGTLEGLAIGTGNEDLVPDWKPRKVKTKKWLNLPSTNRSLFGHLFGKKPVFFNERYLAPFLGRLSGRLIKRGITIETAREWELGVDEENKRAIFVLRDVEGRVAIVKGRDTSGRFKIKYIAYVLDKESSRLVPRIDYEREGDFKRPVKSLFLYGEYQAQKVLDKNIKKRSSDLILVEGEIDTLKVWQFGWNVVGLLGSYPSKEQSEKIVSLIPRDGRLIAMMDNDKAGRKCITELYEMLKNRIPVFDAMLAEGIDPGAATEGEIEKAIVNAKMFKENN